MAQKVQLHPFSAQDKRTWSTLFQRQAKSRESQVHPLFKYGVEKLGISEKFPDLEAINKKLEKISGFRGVPVKGFEEPESFYEMLAQREFPIGFFIRDEKDLGYTPAPDIFHDLYGHLPFLVDSQYANFCQSLGERTIRYRDQPEILRQWERLFWFTAEFGLVRTDQGIRIFGGGIASSIQECDYALSTQPKQMPFDLEVIRNLEFQIDEMQKNLFLLESPEQLYSCLDEFEAGCTAKGNS